MCLEAVTSLSACCGAGEAREGRAGTLGDAGRMKKINVKWDYVETAFELRVVSNRSVSSA